MEDTGRPGDRLKSVAWTICSFKHLGPKGALRVASIRPKLNMCWIMLKKPLTWLCYDLKASPQDLPRQNWSPIYVCSSRGELPESVMWFVAQPLRASWQCVYPYPSPSYRQKIWGWVSLSWQIGDQTLFAGILTYFTANIASGAHFPTFMPIFMCFCHTVGSRDHKKKKENGTKKNKSK